jgi:multicomponent Na+:H+ antiporter subunit A
MWTSLLAPVSILALTALIVWLLGMRWRSRWLSAVAASGTGLTLLTLWRLQTVLPIEGVALSWRPLALFGAPLTFGADAASWSLATLLTAVGALSLLACCISAERVNPAWIALVLASSAVGIAALFATSFVALVMTWGLTDLLLAAGLLHHGQRGVRRAGLTLFSGVVAAAAIWAAPLLVQAEGVSGFLRLTHLTGASTSLLQIAVILRLGLVPLHLWRPIDLTAAPAQLISFVVIPTLMGFDLLTYLVGEPALTTGLPAPIFILAAVTALVGGIGAWSETDERASLASVMVAETGLAVLAVANAGQQAVAAAIAAGIAWALGVTVFALTPGWSGRRFWRSGPSLIALLSLLGVPATLGFVARLTIYSGLEADLLALIVALVGESFAVAALIRLWVWAEPRPLPTQRFLELLYLAMFTLAAAALILTGLAPERFSGWDQGAKTTLPKLAELIDKGGAAGWAGWALPLVAGLALFVAGEGLRQRLEGGWRGLGALLRLEWIYGLVYIAIRWIARLLRGIVGVVEGEGALLWTAVILLIILLYLTGANGGPGV